MKCMLYPLLRQLLPSAVEHFTLFVLINVRHTSTSPLILKERSVFLPLKSTEPFVRNPTERRLGETLPSLEQHIFLFNTLFNDGKIRINMSAAAFAKSFRQSQYLESKFMTGSYLFPV